ncbi:uncharacterized protein LOC100891341 [Strongylocentrotus purpuratus]|uniref:Death domain-containing protein n=1 Tax=Strongylocentrotus purpuratus TaxID=7668 RepID=A0A7M7HHC8_STRPU|nr:uncharacterized protein LOC100891341 [Strongylocentrotus purpuratus]
MSFLPTHMPPSRKPVLEVRFVKKPHDLKWDDVHALKDLCFQPVKGDDDDIVFLQGTLTVACQLREKSPKSEVIQFSDIRTQTKVTKYFELDLTEESDETLVVLEVVQTSTQTIKFNTRFQATTNVAMTPVRGAAFCPMDARSQSAEVPTLSGEVTDEKITKLSKLLPDGKYSELFENLGFKYDHIQKILKKSFMDSTAASKELLHEWKNKGGSTKDLDAALRKVDLGGLVPEYKK